MTPKAINAKDKLTTNKDQNLPYCEKCKKSSLRFCGHCPKCDSPPSEHYVTNFDPISRDGDVECRKCKSCVRMWNAS